MCLHGSKSALKHHLKCPPSPKIAFTAVLSARTALKAPQPPFEVPAQPEKCLQPPFDVPIQPKKRPNRRFKCPHGSGSALKHRLICPHSPKNALNHRLICLYSPRSASNRRLICPYSPKSAFKHHLTCPHNSLAAVLSARFASGYGVGFAGARYVHFPHESHGQNCTKTRRISENHSVIDAT